MSDNDTVIELARLLAEATRARRLAEAAAMDERCGARAFKRNQAADEARRVAEQRGDELKSAQEEIVGLRSRVQTLENAANALAKEVNRFHTERDEARAEVEKLTIDCAQLASANDDLRHQLGDAQAALAVAHEHDAAEVARLRGLLLEVLAAWDRGVYAGRDDREAEALHARARRAARGES